MDPAQVEVPEWLADMVDGHVWPSASPDELSRNARTHCGHIDYEVVWQRAPELFERRIHVGAPPPEELWAARRTLARHGFELILDVQFEVVAEGLALAVYGAGVVGRLTEAAWRDVAPLLTTCTCSVREPREDVDVSRGVMRPGRPPVRGAFAMPLSVRPELWEASDVSHTWWAYPFFGTLREGCTCVAHTSTASGIRFGPPIPGLDSVAAVTAHAALEADVGSPPDNEDAASP
ncbi:hypothetical protein [Saccharothrix sp.]|uniref:hypothetical protein n=1 Tax=Saccharothrix sp. TaxID=1873460 RepID=UPI002810BEBF|nr:hypothetical protein [Saccharothrix sp.]